MVTTLKMVPMVEAVTIPFVTQFMKDGAFHATEAHENAAIALLDEQFRWTDALLPLRKQGG